MKQPWPQPKPERHLFSILNYLKHLLRHRFLFLLLNLCLRLPKLFHSLQFFLSIIESDMRVHIHCDRYIRMPHEVLQCLRIHSRFCHIRAIGVSAYVRCNIWHLYSVNVIVCSSKESQRSDRGQYIQPASCKTSTYLSGKCR